MSEACNRGVVILALAAGACSAPLRVTPVVTAAHERPNIVVIISDDHRWDALGAAGNAAIHTPALDRLALEGAYFRQATVYVAQCTPSRAVLLTGLPPHASGIYSIQSQAPALWWRDSLALPVLPGILTEAGYRTVLIGKWHLQSDPWRTGFTDVRTWLEEGIASYRDPYLSYGNDRGVARREGFTNELFADDAVSFLRSEEARDRPFLLWLALTAPHEPLHPNPGHIERLYAGRGVDDLLPPAFPPGAAPEDFLHYAEAVSLVDDLTSRVLAAVEEEGLAENTVIVFIGDNGHMMGSRGLTGKIVPYDESIRVPLIVYMPGTTGLRGATDAAVSSIDLPPTLVRLAGLEPPADWPGRDLRPLLRGEPAGFEYAFGEWADQESWFGRHTHRLVRSSRHKLIRWRRADRPPELYDLTVDPHETANLYADVAHHHIKQQLEAELDDWLARTHDPAAQWPQGGVVVQDADDPEPDREQARQRAVVVDEAILQTYAGTYELTNRTPISFKLEGGRLYFGGPLGWAELIAVTESYFLHPTEPIRFTFIRDSTGDVDRVTARQRGYDRLARRLR